MKTKKTFYFKEPGHDKIFEAILILHNGESSWLVPPWVKTNPWEWIKVRQA